MVSKLTNEFNNAVVIHIFRDLGTPVERDIRTTCVDTPRYISDFSADERLIFRLAAPNGDIRFPF